MEVFISFASGFAIGWGSVWFIFCIKEIRGTKEEI
jgi:hypothetical protein